MLKNKLVSILAACALAVALPTAAFAADGWNIGPGSMQFLGCISNQSFDTTAEGYECVATFDVTGEHAAATPVLNGPASAIGANVAVSGAVNASGKMVKVDGMGGEIAQFAINVPEDVEGTITVKVGNGPAVNPPAGTDTPTDTPADKPAADKPAAADKSKTSPQTGFETSSVAFVGVGSLVAAGCVAFALRKKVASNK